MASSKGKGSGDGSSSQKGPPGDSNYRKKRSVPSSSSSNYSTSTATSSAPAALSSDASSSSGAESPDEQVVSCGTMAELDKIVTSVREIATKKSQSIGNESRAETALRHDHDLPSTSAPPQTRAPDQSPLLVDLLRHGTITSNSNVVVPNQFRQQTSIGCGLYTLERYAEEVIAEIDTNEVVDAVEAENIARYCRSLRETAEASLRSGSTSTGKSPAIVHRLILCALDGHWDAFISLFTELIRRVLAKGGRWKAESPDTAAGRTFMADAVYRLLEESRLRDQNVWLPMLLSGRAKGRKHCHRLGHGYCRILETLLASLDSKSLDAVLDNTSSSGKRNLLHFAVASGAPCQLDVVLRFCNRSSAACLSATDASGGTPLALALGRNIPFLVKQMLAAGADPSQLGRSAAKPGSTLRTRDWLTDRIDALKQLNRDIVESLLSDRYVVKDSFTVLHVMRLGGGDGDGSHSTVMEVSQSSRLQRPGLTRLLVVTPVFYGRNEHVSIAKFPAVNHTALSRDTVAEPHLRDKPIVNVRSQLTLLDPLQNVASDYDLQPVTSMRDGRLYAWELSSQVPAFYELFTVASSPRIRFTIQTDKRDVPEMQQKFVHLWTQGFFVQHRSTEMPLYRELSSAPPPPPVSANASTATKVTMKGPSAPRSQLHHGIIKPKLD